MDENHQDKAGSKLIASEVKLWLPPLSPEDQEKVDRLQRNNRRKASHEWIGFSGKSVWDWLNLLGVLAIPFVVTVVGLYFTQQITQQQVQLSERQHQTDIQIAADQQRETTLKTCLDDIKDLLLNKSLRASKPQDEVRVVARVEVLAALRQLDGGRKGLLIQFLSEAGLIISVGNDVVIDLQGADLIGADLIGADLTGADLIVAGLQGADLTHADLTGADLTGADLTFAIVMKEQLAKAKSLTGATMPDGTKHP